MNLDFFWHLCRSAFLNGPFFTRPSKKWTWVVVTKITIASIAKVCPKILMPFFLHKWIICLGYKWQKLSIFLIVWILSKFIDWEDKKAPNLLDKIIRKLPLCIFWNENSISKISSWDWDTMTELKPALYSVFLGFVLLTTDGAVLKLEIFSIEKPNILFKIYFNFSFNIPL